MYWIAGQTAKGVGGGLYEDYGDSKYSPGKLMNNGFGSSSNTVTVNKSENLSPWTAQQPYLTDVFSKAQGLYQTNPQTAPISPYTQMGWNLTAQRALQGSPVTDAMQTNIQDTLQGRYLRPGYGADDENPYFADSVTRALDKAKGSFMSTYGSPTNENLQNSGFKEGLARVLAETATDAYNQNYQIERNRQLQAAALAPNAALQDYLNLQQLSSVGASQDARSVYEQQAPLAALAAYLQAINGTYGRVGTGSEDKPYFENQGANALGMISGGMGIFSQGQKNGWWGKSGSSTGGSGTFDGSMYSGQDLGQADFSAGYY